MFVVITVLLKNKLSNHQIKSVLLEMLLKAVEDGSIFVAHNANCGLFENSIYGVIEDNGIRNMPPFIMAHLAMVISSP